MSDSDESIETSELPDAVAPTGDPDEAIDQTAEDGVTTVAAAAESSVESAEAEAAAADAQAAPLVSESVDGSAFVEAVGNGLSWWPFAVLLLCWIALTGASVYFLGDASVDLPARFHPEYRWLVIAGLILSVVSPLVSLGVWLVARVRREGAARRGLFVVAMVRGALTAFFGALLWVAALYLLDLYALGGLPW